MRSLKRKAADSVGPLPPAKLTNRRNVQREEHEDTDASSLRIWITTLQPRKEPGNVDTVQPTLQAQRCDEIVESARSTFLKRGPPFANQVIKRETRAPASAERSDHETAYYPRVEQWQAIRVTENSLSPSLVQQKEQHPLQQHPGEKFRDGRSLTPPEAQLRAVQEEMDDSGSSLPVDQLHKAVFTEFEQTVQTLAIQESDNAGKRVWQDTLREFLLYQNPELRSIKNFVTTSTSFAPTLRLTHTHSPATPRGNLHLTLHTLDPGHTHAYAPHKSGVPTPPTISLLALSSSHSKNTTSAPPVHHPGTMCGRRKSDSRAVETVVFRSRALIST
ncbi:hypothetical protein IWZ00DRAFT_565784 [Phyllosticta capitalensis]